MSYCTVQEAWGPEFGHSNFKATLQAPPQTRNNNGNSNNGNIEHFSAQTYDDNVNTQYATVNEPRTNHSPGVGYHDINQRKQYTLGKSAEGYPKANNVNTNSKTFYPVDSDAGKESILNYSYDYVEESQLNKPVVGSMSVSHCDSAFKHLNECRECRLKLIHAIGNPEPSNAATHQAQVSGLFGTGYQVDATELALFIACGIFFIFLLDAIVKMARKFK